MRNLLRDVESAEAPAASCLNRSPTVRFLGLRNGPEGAPPEVAAAVGQPLKLFGSVRGRGAAPRWGAGHPLAHAERPRRVTFSAPGEPRTLASFDAAGATRLELWAGDGKLEGSNRVAVTVGPAP